ARSPALVVTNAGNDAPLAGAKILTAGHPVPDAAGKAAAKAVEQALREASPGDRVLALISGGASAMLPAPAPGISLADKQEVSRLLLAAGADIGQMNLLRQALSRLKGGGWLRVSGAPITALILSDVPGDDMRIVASGPTATPLGTRDDAAELARALGLWDRLPQPVRNLLEAPAPPRSDAAAARNILVGGNAQSVRAICEAGAAPGPELYGDVADCAARLLAAARDVPPGGAIAMGGETTVILRGDGIGGRNQELALRFALAAEDLPGDWALAAIGSDGRDGPGDAAGGLVTQRTIARIRDTGIDPAESLRRNDSGPALEAGGALVKTGATGTNVADFAVFVRKS
ncbi:MAG: DUF4147 domain-containing protein, partial [Paracoccus sp. (in: a-proteobacteria)]|nr:DUF4147 domain-containing protein [Paracoccus sp. (in: a-proteobacteria)]